MKQESNLIDLKKRILFTIFILIVYRFGTFVPIPGIDTKVLEKIFSGSASNMFLPGLNPTSTIPAHQGLDWVLFQTGG